MRLLIVRRQIVSYSLSSGPRFSKEHSLWNVPRLCPFVLLVKGKYIVLLKQCSAELLCSGPRFSKERCLWNVPRFCPFVLLVKAICSASETVFRGTSMQWFTIFQRALSVECSQILPVRPSGKGNM